MCFLFCRIELEPKKPKTTAYTIENMKLKLLFLALSFPFFLMSKEYLDISAIPENLKANAHTVVRNWEQQINIESLKSYKLHTKLCLSILDKNGLNNSFFAVNTDSYQSLRNFKAIVYDENGKKIRSFSSTDLIDHSYIDGSTFYADNRVKFLDPKHQNYPFSIEFEYDLDVKQTFMLPEWSLINYNISVENAKLKIHIPENIHLKFKKTLLEEPLINKEEGTAYEWQLKNLIAQSPEELSPQDKVNYPNLELALDSFSVSGYNGSNLSWNKLGLWASKLLENKQELPESVKSDIDKITQNCKDNRSKAKLIYEYMQGKTRYVSIQVGIGGWEPYTASKTNEIGYGDCKALANYTTALLNQANIESYYCLIKAGSQSDLIDTNFVSNQFNHAVVCVPFEKDTVWLECTSQRMPFGFLGDFTDDRYALIVNKDKSQLAKTKSYQVSDNTIEREAKINFNAIHSAKAIVNSKFIGLAYSDYLNIYYADQQNKLKYITEKINLKNFKLNDFSLENHNSEIPHISQTLDLDLSNWIINQSNKVFYMPINILFESCDVPTRYRNRQNDLFIRRSSSFSNRVEITLPKEFEIKSRIDNILIESKFGTYSLNFNFENTKLKVNRKLQVFKGNFTKEDYNLYREFLLSVQEHDNTLIEITPLQVSGL